jgi:hypothetical protein
VLEKTFDFYAQDKEGNVWYLGEDTTQFLPNGKTDTSGSFVAGVNGAQPGIIMEANPQIPDAYRQECAASQAEDTAWVERGSRYLEPVRDVGRHAVSTPDGAGKVRDLVLPGSGGQVLRIHRRQSV